MRKIMRIGPNICAVIWVATRYEYNIFQRRSGRVCRNGDCKKSNTESYGGSAIRLLQIVEEVN